MKIRDEVVRVIVYFVDRFRDKAIHELYKHHESHLRLPTSVTAKYLDCPNLVGEVTGRCQHPFVEGSGTGVFEGIKEARLDMRDDVSVGNFPYKGHILF